MDDSTGLLIVVAVVAVLAATLFLFIIPEPSERAVIANERMDVAVLSFDNSSSWPDAQNTLARRIESRLVSADGIDVYSRAQLDALLMEHALGDTGFIEPTTAVEIGSLTGVSKLIAGSVFAVDTAQRETTICTSWQGGDCVADEPAIEYSVRMRAQIEVVDARTGRVERSLDVQASDTTTMRATTTFGGFDSLLADASTSIAEDVVATLTDAYTRELRYGLYASAERKRGGWVGEDESSRFSQSGGVVHLIVHFTRVLRSESFDIIWTAPDGTSVLEEADVVSSGDWRRYLLDVSGLPTGRYRVTGFLGGEEAFSEPFSIVP